MTKAAATLEDVIKRLEELKSGILRNELQISRLEAKLDGEKIEDNPITRAELKTRDEVGKLCNRIAKLQERGLV